MYIYRPEIRQLWLHLPVPSLSLLSTPPPQLAVIDQASTVGLLRGQPALSFQVPRQRNSWEQSKQSLRVWSKLDSFLKCFLKKKRTCSLPRSRTLTLRESCTKCQFATGSGSKQLLHTALNNSEPKFKLCQREPDSLSSTLIARVLWWVNSGGSTHSWDLAGLHWGPNL